MTISSFHKPSSDVNLSEVTSLPNLSPFLTKKDFEKGPKHNLFSEMIVEEKEEKQSKTL
jgi:hypothetical protein